MRKLIMDLAVSGCFGTTLAPSARAFYIVFSREVACSRKRFIIEYMTNRPMPTPISQSAGGSGTA